MSGKLAQILRATLPEYRKSHQLTSDQVKACAAVIRCRTGELGSLKATCHCGYSQELACSCRNRHCPLCQGEAALKWKERYEERLPDVPTYHGVFTLPDTLHPFFRARPREMYALLFDTVSATLQRFSDQDRRLQGARLGIIGVLHTWGSQMQFHPHLHLLICAGGFTRQGKWRSLPASRGFLFSVKSLANVFRGMLLERMERVVHLEPGGFGLPLEQLLSLLRRASLKDWSVFLQRSRKSPVHALGYLARYTHRVAISEGRIQSVAAGQVSIGYRRRGEAFLAGSLKLASGEFVRRFLAHILPGGFHKVRSYGFLARGWREALRESGSHRALAAGQGALSARLCPSCRTPLSYLLCAFSLRSARRRFHRGRACAQCAPEAKSGNAGLLATARDPASGAFSYRYREREKGGGARRRSRPFARTSVEANGLRVSRRLLPTLRPAMQPPRHAPPSLNLSSLGTQ